MGALADCVCALSSHFQSSSLAVDGARFRCAICWAAHRAKSRSACCWRARSSDAWTRWALGLAADNLGLGEMAVMLSVMTVFQKLIPCHRNYPLTPCIIY